MPYIISRITLSGHEASVNDSKEAANKYFQASIAFPQAFAGKVISSHI